MISLCGYICEIHEYFGRLLIVFFFKFGSKRIKQTFLSFGNLPLCSLFNES